MSLFFDRCSPSVPILQLGLVAVLSAAITTGVIFSLYPAQSHDRVRDAQTGGANTDQSDVTKRLTNSVTGLRSAAAHREEEQNRRIASRAQQGDYDEDDGLSKLRQAFVIIVGCGGVGSHAAAALARSGVSKIRLIDFDQVTLSSLNRHALATLADVGTPKVSTIRQRLEAITPWVHFDCRNELFSGASAAQQLGPMEDQQPDFIIDAIDNIDSKVALLHYCHRNQLRVISSMGAGAKSDPTRIFIGDVSCSTDDPLSKSTRRRLRLLGVKEGIPVVFSTEKPAPGKAVLQPLDEAEVKKGNVDELSVLQNFRIRILPVLGTMPAIFGLCVANHVMLAISGYPHEYLAFKSRKQMHEAIYGALLALEDRLARRTGKDTVGMKIACTVDDVGFIVDEIYRGRSIISGLSTRLVLTRWNPPREDMLDSSVPGQKVSKLDICDLVCMTKEESSRHEKLILTKETQHAVLYSSVVLENVERRRNEVIDYQKYRV